VEFEVSKMSAILRRGMEWLKHIPLLTQYKCR
jgi:hypothetical protein